MASITLTRATTTKKRLGLRVDEKTKEPEPTSPTPTAAAADTTSTPRPTLQVRSDARVQARAHEAHLAAHLLSGTNGNLGGIAGGMGMVPSADDQALFVVEQNFATFDDPGGGDGDGIVSEDDLRTIAEGDYDESLQTAANHLLNDGRALFDQLDQANGRGGNDDKFSRSDLFALLARRNVDRPMMIPEHEGPAPEETFEVPHDHDHFTVGTDESERTPAVIAAQEAAILEALETGEPVEFTNTEGDTEEIRLTQNGGNGRDYVSYELETSDGQKVEIRSGLSYNETRVALARLTDSFTQVPEHHRDELRTITLEAGPDEDRPEVAARYRWEVRGLGPFRRETKEEMVFYNGLRNINEAIFDHEFGHAVSKQLPDGWEEAMQADGASPSQYANTNGKEDFAEFWAAYVEARQTGPEALAALEAAFPNRFPIAEHRYENG